jgi:hypothetical protein
MTVPDVLYYKMEAWAVHMEHDTEVITNLKKVAS